MIQTFDELLARALTHQMHMPDEDYLLLFGAAFYSVAYTEIDLKFAILKVSTEYNLSYTAESLSGLTFGEVVGVFRNCLKSSRDTKLRKLLKDVTPQIDRMSILRNGMAHGYPRLDIEEAPDSRMYKLFKDNGDKSFFVTKDVLRELFSLSGDVQLKVNQVTHIVYRHSYKRQIDEGIIRPYTESEVKDMLEEERITNDVN